MMAFRSRYSVLLFTAVCIALPGGAMAENGAPVVAPASADVLKRLDRIERSLNSQSLIDMYNQLQTLQSQVRDLRGQLETQQHLINEMIERQKELYADTDTRLQALEGSTAGDEAASPDDDFAVDDPAIIDTASTDNVGNVTNEAANETNTDPAGGDPDQAKAAYDQAFELLKAGQYEQAIAAFNDYLQQYPNSEYADNAHYWLGESYYVTRDFGNAIGAYQKVLSLYPNSQKAPHALLKIGYSQQELGQIEQARATLQDVRNRYPDTTAASLASERLQQL